MTPLKTAQAIAELSPPTDVSAEYAKGVIETNNDEETEFWIGTQAEYDAIVTKDAGTIYHIETEDAIGDRTYTEQNVVTNGQTLTASIDELDKTIGDIDTTLTAILGV
jgi:hypothetical protein